MKLKHRLPAYSVIDHLCLDEILLQQLVTCVAELRTEFKTLLEANKGLVSDGFHDFVKTVYDTMFEVSLTDSTLPNNSISMDEYTTTTVALKAAGYRHKRNLTVDNNSLHNEATYTVKTSIYKKYSHVFDQVFSKFKGKPTRIRIVKLLAGTNIVPHIDYDPSYAVRIIIPIIADSECINVFWVKNTVSSVNLAPGNAYFLNTGYKHAVVNFSKQDRYTFMISVNGTEDIQHLIT